MNVLPWLVIHGAAVWRAGLAVFLLGGLAFAWSRPRLAARRAAKAARRQLGWPVGISERRRGARVTLAGTLEAAEVPCQPDADGAGSRSGLRTRAPEAAVSGGGASARAGRLLLAVGDARVRLDGPIEILSGSREAWPGRLPGAAEAPVHRSLSSGDRVRVSGVLTEEASDEAPSYRDPAKRWTLGDGLVAAFEGQPRVSGPAPLVRVPPLIAAGALFLGVFGAGGEVAMNLARRELRGYSVGAAGPGHAVLVAAATPFRRREALGALVRALDARSDPDPQALAARAALHDLRGEPVEVAEMWIAHGEPERGARLAESAGSFALAARGWYAAGDFERAADAWERTGADADETELRFGLGVNLLAQRLDRAARAARGLARAFRAHPPGNDELRRWYETRADTVRCLADALDARRGDAGAWQALHGEPAEPLLPACAILRVDLFDGAERIRAIQGLPQLATDVHDVPREWLDLLAAEADVDGDVEAAPPFESAAEVLAIPNGEPLARAVPGVERRLAEMAGDGRPRITGRRMLQVGGGRHVCMPMWSPARTQGRARASAAMFAYLAGDEAGGQALALRAAESDERCITEVPAVTALPADPRPAQEMVGHTRGEFLHGLLDFVVERNAAPLLDAFTHSPPPDPDEKQAWALAAAGDGAGLCRWLRRPRSQPGTFLRLGAPLLRTGRDDVARWVRWGHHAHAGFRPTEEVVHLANLAAAADALAPDEAAPLHARAARFREAILRRETAVPLAVIERL
jgi:hypothetical protein